MSDFLLSELLVLSLLLPVLIRPFCKYLKKGYALSILPVISIFVCICIIIGQGFTLTFVIIGVFAVIVSLSELIRLAAFFQGVFNDFYTLPSKALRLVLLLLFSGITVLVFHFSPEAAYLSAQVLTDHPVELPAETGNPITARLLEPAGGSVHRKLLIITAEAFPYRKQAGNAASVLADRGYTVLDITALERPRVHPRFTVYRRIVPLMVKTRARYPAKKTDPAYYAFFEEFIGKAAAQYGQHKQIFCYTEGMYTEYVRRFAAEHPGVLSGVFFHLSEEEPLPDVPNGWAIHDRSSIISSEDDGGSIAAENPSDETTAAAVTGKYQPFYFYISPHDRLAGFGSLREDDILAAVLLGSSRDLAGRDRDAVLGCFQGWIEKRLSGT